MRGEMSWADRVNMLDEHNFCYNVPVLEEVNE